MPPRELPDGGVPTALLEDDEHLAVAKPPTEHLQDGEEVKYAFPISRVKAKGWDFPRNGGRVGLLTDRRVLLFPGSRPVSFPYQQLTVSSKSGLSSYHFTLVYYTDKYPDFAVTVGSGSSTYVGRKANCTDESKVRSTIEREQRMARKRKSQLEDMRDELDGALRSAPTPPLEDFESELNTLVGGYALAQRAVQKARSLCAVDDEEVVTDRSQFESHIRRAFEARIGEIKRAFDASSYERGISMLIDTRSRLARGPIESEELNAELDSLEGDLHRTRFDFHLTNGQTDTARDLLIESLSTSGSQWRTDGGVEFFTTQVVETAQNHERAATSLVATLFEDLDGFQGGKLARTLDGVYESNPRLFDGVDPLIAAGLVGDSNPDNRLVACKALQRVGGPGELDTLRSRTGDDEYEVRVAAMRALRTVADREDITLSEGDQEDLRSVNIEYHGQGDVVAGDYADQSTSVEDSILNRSSVGSDVATGVDSTPSFCPSCGTTITDYTDPSFCPSCGFEL